MGDATAIDNIVDRCVTSFHVEFQQWIGARKRFKDYDQSTLAPELGKIWAKVLEQQVKNRQIWLAGDSGAGQKYKEFLDKLHKKVPETIEETVQ